MEGLDKRVAALGGEGASVLQGFQEVVAVLDEFNTLREHGAILLPAVAVRDDDDGFETEEARGKADALTEIAAGSSDHALEVWLRSLEPFEIDESAAKLEGADGGVVLVLDPGFDTGLARRREALIDQRPGILRRRRHGAIDDLLGFADLGQGGQLHGDRILVLPAGARKERQGATR